MAGTATDKLYGVAEGLWEPDLVSPREALTDCRNPILLISRRIGTGGPVRDDLTDDLECHGPGRVVGLGSRRACYVSLTFPVNEDGG